MNIGLVLMWALLVAVGIALMVVGVLMKRTSAPDRQGKSRVFIGVGIALFIGGGAALRQELTRS